MLKHLALGLTLTILVQLMFTIGLSQQRALDSSNQQHHDLSNAKTNDLESDRFERVSALATIIQHN
jgi:hypothetical protein